MTSQAPARVRVAHVLRPHGVRGDVRVEPLGGDADRFTPGMRVHVAWGGAGATARTLVVRSARAHGAHLLIGFEGIDAPEHAAALRGAYLSVDRSAVRVLPPGEWFVWQIVGMEARDIDGRPLGTVTDVEEGVANDVLVVGDGRSARRFPMVDAFVAEVDIAGGRITLRPWEEEP